MSIVVTSAATAAATSAAVAANAAAAARRKADCDALMADYRHEGATLAMQQAYAACVPAPPAAVPPAGLKLAVALLLLAIPIALTVAWRERRGDDGGWMAGAFAAIAWVLALTVLALVVAGVRFLFS